MGSVSGAAKRLKIGKVPRVAYVEDADDDGNILSGINPIYSQNEIDEVPADSHNAEWASDKPPQVFSHGSNPLRRPARYPTDFRNLEYKTISRDNTADENSRRAASFAYLGSKLTSCHDKGLKLKSMRPSLPVHKNEIPTTKTAYAYPKHPLGDKPFLCTHEGCEYSIPGKGFPRQWHLRDHLRRVHGEQDRPEVDARVSPESFVEEIKKQDSEWGDPFSGMKIPKSSWKNSREDSRGVLRPRETSFSSIKSMFKPEALASLTSPAPMEQETSSQIAPAIPGLPTVKPFRPRAYPAGTLWVPGLDTEIPSSSATLTNKASPVGPSELQQPFPSFSRPLSLTRSSSPKLLKGPKNLLSLVNGLSRVRHEQDPSGFPEPKFQGDHINQSITKDLPSSKDLGRMEDSLYVPFPYLNSLPEPDDFFRQTTNSTFRNHNTKSDMVGYGKTPSSSYRLSPSFGASPRPPGGADLNSLPTPCSAPLSTPSTVRSWTPQMQPEYRKSLKKNRVRKLSSTRAAVDRHKPRSSGQLNLGVKSLRPRQPSPASSEQWTWAPY
ncbi:hypothetical protein F5Y01DRAFT_276147 [Xylaria sp. FL0043]|nr:hypothetical protein F5Y01DRAFT_276147 [Xylaria sp. FL0043]